MLINLAQSPLLGNINKIIPKKVMKSFTKVNTTFIVDSFSRKVIYMFSLALTAMTKYLHNIIVSIITLWDAVLRFNGYYTLTLLMGSSLHLGNISLSSSSFLIN